MMPRPTPCPRPSFLSRSVLCAAVAAVSSFTLADELPTFKPGLWEFKRTVEDARIGQPTHLEDKRCIDPGAEMRRTNDMLAQQGCKVTPFVRSGGEYRFTSTCQIQGKRYESHSVITVESDSAYRVVITGSGAGSASKETLVAKRAGDCPP